MQSSFDSVPVSRRRIVRLNVAQIGRPDFFNASQHPVDSLIGVEGIPSVVKLLVKGVKGAQR